MIKIEKNIMINRPIEEVFEYVINVENLPQWAGPVLEAKQSSEGPLSVGTTQTHVVNFLGRQAEISYEVTEYEPNKKFSTLATSGPIPMETIYNFEPVAEGTMVKLKGKVDAGGFFKLAEPVVAPMLKRQVETDTNNLKALLEAQA